MQDKDGRRTRVQRLMGIIGAVPLVAAMLVMGSEAGAPSAAQAATHDLKTASSIFGLSSSLASELFPSGSETVVVSEGTTLATHQAALYATRIGAPLLVSSS